MGALLRDFALEQVGVGWPVYSTRRFVDPMADKRLGGLVVEILGGGTDRDTGETWPTRYRCLPTWRTASPWHVLDADEIDLDQLSGINRGACAAAAILLLRPFAISTSGRRRPALRGHDDVERIHDAWRLAAAWAS
jgi:hypothetical protein